MQAKQQISLWYIILAPITLAIITAFVYYPSLHFAFQFDDLPNISKCFNIRHNTLADLFFSGSRWISYWINALHYSIGKFDPFSYRMGNLLIHLTNGMLVFGLLYFLLSAIPFRNPSHAQGKRDKNKQDKSECDDNFFTRNAFGIATLTTTLFLLHPAHTQTVSYVIQGQLEGLATMSMLIMLALYTCYARNNNAGLKSISALLLIASAALACCTKEITIVAPALLMLTDWFLIAQGNWEKFKTRFWLLGAVTATMGACYVYFLKPVFFKNLFTFGHVAHNNIGNMLTQNPTEQIKPFQFFISQFKVIVHYLVMYLWPFNMSVEYDWKLSQSIFAPDAFLPLLVLIALALGVVYALKKNKTSLIAFAALWFIICVAPRSSFIPSSELLADYKAYAASIGWLFIIAAAIIKVIELATERIPQLIQANTHPANRQLIFVATAFLICLPLAIATKQHNNIWSSGLEFWGAMIKNAPGKARAYNNYGVELAQNLGKWKESVPYYKKAIAMDKYYPDPCNNLAVAYAQLNDLDNAIEAMQWGLKINPAFPEGYNNLAAFHLQKKDFEGAIKHLNTAIKLRPHYGKAHYNLGRTYLQQNKMEEAWASFKNCCMHADMDNETGFSCYAQTSFALHKYEDTILACKKLLEINPRHENALFALANSYYLLTQYDAAKETYKKMLRYYPNDTRALFNAGETCLRMNKPADALAYFEQCERQPSHAPEVNQRLVSCRQLVAQLNT